MLWSLLFPFCLGLPCSLFSSVLKWKVKLLIWDLFKAGIYSYKHPFKYCFHCISLVWVCRVFIYFQVFLISLDIFLWLIGYLGVYNFHIFPNFQLPFYFHFLIIGKYALHNFNSFKLIEARFMVSPIIYWSMSIHALEKNAYSAVIKVVFSIHVR